MSLPAGVISRAGRALGVVLPAEAVVRKRRSLGLPTGRGTWVRISACPVGAAAERGALEATVGLPAEVGHPRWHQGAAWRQGDVLWRADEMELVTEQVVQPGGILTRDPGLPGSWWQRLAVSVAALGTVPTARVATPHIRPITQQRVSERVHAVFPGMDAAIEDWAVAHADLSWVNLTAPGCRVLDWEDWGRAPRGWDAATLWASSLAVPELAEQVQRVFGEALSSRTGLVCQLYACAELLAARPEYAGPLAAPAAREGERVVSLLGGRRL